MRTARVNHRGTARWQRGHPWIFRSDVVDVPAGDAGAVLVQTERGRNLGMALWSPKSQISLRRLTSDERPIGPDFWRDRLEAAGLYRDSLAIQASAYRLVHGEADGLPSLVVDRYEGVLVVQFLSAGLEVYREPITAALLSLFAPSGILARNDVPVRRAEGLPEQVELLYGSVPEELEVQEAGVRFVAAPWSGQKTGAFLDQRENRIRAGQLARGRALDCFSYHGSFALHMATQAAQVVALDSSAPALLRARQTAELNGFGNVATVEANVFDYLREQEALGVRFDTIVLDPPAFAKRRDAVDSALRAYKEINLRALKLLAAGGLLHTYSCSHHVGPALFRQMLDSAAADVRRPVRWIETRGQALDHPEILQIPETAYLKGAILQVQ